MKKAIPYLFYAVYVTAIIVLVIMIVNRDNYPLNGYMPDSNCVHSEIQP